MTASSATAPMISRVRPTSRVTEERGSSTRTVSPSLAVLLGGDDVAHGLVPDLDRRATGDAHDGVPVAGDEAAQDLGVDLLVPEDAAVHDADQPHGLGVHPVLGTRY